MHKIEIAPEALEFGRALRGGRDRLFERIDLARTAHLIVDMQNGFVEPGAPVEVPYAKEIVDNINAISRAVRAGGGTNVFLRMTINPESQKSWSNWFEYFYTRAGVGVMAESFAPNSHGWRLWPALDVDSSDLTVDKTRFGAFVPGASNLHDVLQKGGVDTLIITGTLTNCCCESTARDAMQMNYKLVFVTDANAALSDFAHNATLSNMAMLFADVLDTSQTVDLVRRSALAPAAE
jgi:ureidoacrylate peracid hydrolase